MLEVNIPIHLLRAKTSSLKNLGVGLFQGGFLFFRNRVKVKPY